MKSLYFSLVLITVLLLSSCSYALLEGENIATLPGPMVRISRPTETPNPSATISTLEPISEPNIAISNSGSQTSVPRMAFGTESHLMDFQSHTVIIGETGLQLVRWR
jgi:hypothetical protein